MGQGLEMGTLVSQSPVPDFLYFVGAESGSLCQEIIGNEGNYFPKCNAFDLPFPIFNRHKYKTLRHSLSQQALAHPELVLVFLISILLSREISWYLQLWVVLT